MTKTYRFKLDYNNEVEVFTEEQLMNTAHDLREFLNVDNFYIREPRTVEEAIIVLELAERTYLDR